MHFIVAKIYTHLYFNLSPLTHLCLLIFASQSSPQAIPNSLIIIPLYERSRVGRYEDKDECVDEDGYEGRENDKRL